MLVRDVDQLDPLPDDKLRQQDHQYMVKVGCNRPVSQ
jgi:hypothetical protein